MYGLPVYVIFNAIYVLYDMHIYRYRMQEAIRAKGLRAIGQKLCRSEAEVTSFIRALPTPIAVVKPNESAGSDHIYLCRGSGSVDSVVQEALVGFNAIHGQFNNLGQVNDGALVQV